VSGVIRHRFKFPPQGKNYPHLDGGDLIQGPPLLEGGLLGPLSVRVTIKRGNSLLPLFLFINFFIFVL